MIYTTLNRIREHDPCADGWGKLLKYLGKTGPDDAPLAYIVILDAVGLDDALWCLRAEPQHTSIWRMYAVRCARRMQHMMKDERSLHVLETAERHARGLATDEELAAARDAAWSAARHTARHTAWSAAKDATWAAAWAAAKDAAWDAAKDAAWAAIWAATWSAARAEQAADFKAMLAAHHAMPGESCALVDWWQGESND